MVAIKNHSLYVRLIIYTQLWRKVSQCDCASRSKFRGCVILRACILTPPAVYLQCLWLQVTLVATASISAWGFACRTSEGLDVVYLRVTWDLPEVQVNLLGRRIKFNLPVVSNSTREIKQSAGIFPFSENLFFFNFSEVVTRLQLSNWCITKVKFTPTLTLRKGMLEGILSVVN